MTKEEVFNCWVCETDFIGRETFISHIEEVHRKGKLNDKEKEQFCREFKKRR